MHSGVVVGRRGGDMYHADQCVINESEQLTVGVFFEMSGERGGAGCGCSEVGGAGERIARTGGSDEPRDGVDRAKRKTWARGS